MKKYTFQAITITAMLSISAHAYEFNGSASVTSNDMFRGTTLSDDGAAANLKGTLSASAEGTTLFGTASATVTNETEDYLDFVVGLNHLYSTGITTGLFAQYEIRPTGNDDNYTEVGISAEYDAVSGEITQVVGSNNGAVEQKGDLHYQLSGTIASSAGIDITGTVGRTDLDNSMAKDFTHYRIGATYSNITVAVDQNEIDYDLNPSVSYSYKF